jgi:hypothetical protein
VEAPAGTPIENLLFERRSASDRNGDDATATRARVRTLQTDYYVGARRRHGDLIGATLQLHRAFST